jgi:hypothetical protein
MLNSRSKNKNVKINNLNAIKPSKTDIFILWKILNVIFQILNQPIINYILYIYNIIVIGERYFVDNSILYLSKTLLNREFGLFKNCG